MICWCYDTPFGASPWISKVQRWHWCLIGFESPECGTIFLCETCYETNDGLGKNLSVFLHCVWRKRNLLAILNDKQTLCFHRFLGAQVVRRRNLTKSSTGPPLFPQMPFSDLCLEIKSNSEGARRRFSQLPVPLHVQRPNRIMKERWGAFHDL